MNEKALTVAEEQALALLDPADLLPAGMDNLEHGDTGMPPRLRISQANRPIMIGDESAPAGSIVNTVTGETFDRIEIVPLVFLPPSRVMWPANFSADNDPRCLSDDGKFPFTGNGGRLVTDQQSGPCEVCPWTRFGDDTPPQCKRQRNFLVLILDSMEPAILTMQSTALKAARNLTTLARTQGLRKSVVFVTRLEKSDKGQWHVPAFVKGRKLTTTELLAIVEAKGEFANLVIQADIESVGVDSTEYGSQGEIPGEPGSKDEVPF